ncbi:hypothetical protein R1sor_002503 [Riccia sorocarpa]|uniref:Uncharacterized protein n=1 Tax=Riccia sorocarpa TaxID=122646 RepID=A0ABD3H147_9MARC
MSHIADALVGTSGPRRTKVMCDSHEHPRTHVCRFCMRKSVVFLYICAFVIASPIVHPTTAQIDDVLQENGPEIALSNGDRVRVKTWDWTEPVSAEEVLEDTLQCYQEWKSGTRIPWMLISTLRPKFFPWRQYEITPS